MEGKYSIFLAGNSEEIRNRLAGEGFGICHCCSFKESKWLSYLKQTNTIHGVGYGCENECENGDCLKCAVMRDADKRITIITPTVDEFVSCIHDINK